MKKEYILFIDSGIGGLSTLAETIKSFNYNYLYFADNKNCPYGNHSKQEIFSYLKNIIDQLTKKYNFKFVIIACNTATSAAIDKLRTTFNNIIFIGTEPAINLASKNGHKKILSLTTPLTKKLERYKTLKQKSSSKIKTLSINNLVENIENFLFLDSPKNRFNLLKDIFFICKTAKFYDCIVLGCTHYVLIKPQILEFLDIKIYDGNEGVSKNLLNLLKENHIKPLKKSSIKVLLSQKNYGLTKKYEKILSQTLANFNIMC